MKVPGIPYVQGRNAYSDSDGTKYGVAIHNTSNDASAEGEASYATRRTDGISAHLYVDADSVVQSLDTASKAGHAGSSQGNENAIAVEITGMNGWTRAQWLERVAWDKLGAVLAQVCRYYGVAVRRASVAEMKANPKVRAFYGHDDMRLAWGGTTHTDPGPGFPWDRLFTAISGGDMTTLDDIHVGPDGNRRSYAKLIADLHGEAFWRLYGDGFPKSVQARLTGLAADVAAVKTALAALAQTGGSVDTAVLLGKMQELAEADRSRDDAHAAELAELRRERVELAARLAAAYGDSA